jgi:hypothetical protein
MALFRKNPSRQFLLPLFFSFFKLFSTPSFALEFRQVSKTVKTLYELAAGY